MQTTWVFSAALQNTWSILFLPLTPTVSCWQIDGDRYSFTFISAAYAPDVIYAVPLTSLSPSSFLSSLALFFLTHLPFLPSFPPLCIPVHTSLLLLTALTLFSIQSSPLLLPPSSLCSLSPLCRVLCPMGIRVVQQTTSATARRGKLMRRSSWQTTWGCFRKTVKCLSNWGKVPSNLTS